MPAFQDCGAKFQMRTHFRLLQLDQHCYTVIMLSWRPLGTAAKGKLEV